MAIIRFLDTYALVEIGKGVNTTYSTIQSAPAVTTKLNLLELYFVFLREKQPERGRELFNQFSPFCIDISDDVLLKAAEMRLQFLKRNFSYIDCIGYILSQQCGLLFVTGDAGFAGFRGVELLP